MMTTRDVGSRRRIGLGLATALVIGNMIGSGVFLLPAALASYGGISLVGWTFTAVGAFLLAWVLWGEDTESETVPVPAPAPATVTGEPRELS